MGKYFQKLWNYRKHLKCFQYKIVSIEMVRRFLAIRRFCAQAKVRPFEEIPGPTNYNYIGSLTAFAKDFKEFGISQDTVFKLVTAYNRKYGPIFRIGVPGNVETKTS